MAGCNGMQGGTKTSWIFGPRGNLAVCDMLLAQKIALETMELDALTKANRNRTFSAMQNSALPSC